MTQQPDKKDLKKNATLTPGDKEPDLKTDREIEREEENRDFMPVILKWTDESLRHPDDILELAIAEGLEQLNRRFLSLFLSAIAAGLILGFSAMSVAVVETWMLSLDRDVFARLATAFVYPLGFVLCIMSGTQLFTEHTATAVYPVLDRQGTVGKLLRLWLIVLVGNLLGAIASAGFLVAADGVIGAQEGYLAIGRHLVEFSAGSLFVSAILAGWLMALGAWLVMATQPTLSQMASIYIVTFVIGIGGLHHSIAGSVEILTAYFIASEFSFRQVASFVLVAVAGNLVGGSIFVALLNYGHIRETQRMTSNGSE